MLNSLDVLYIVLAIGIALMSIFLSILLVYAILILRDINKAAMAIKDSAEHVNAVILKPVQMAHEIFKYAKPVVDMVEKRMKKDGEEEFVGKRRGEGKRK